MRRSDRPGGIRLRQLVRALACPTVSMWTTIVWASAAGAQCLTGGGATGFESGSHTLSVSIPNSPTATQLVGINCESGFGVVGPLTKINGAGEARFVATPLGHRSHTALLVGGDGTGSGGASVLGSARYGVRATPTPSYTGPLVVDVDVTLQADVSGSVSVSGVGSAGGTYSTEVSLRPLDSQIGVVLFVGNNALSPRGSFQLTNSAPIDVDRDYVLQIVHTQNVSASYAPGPMGVASSASSDGIVALSFETTLSVADPDLAIEYPMVGILGGPAPSLGNPPPFPEALPIGDWARVIAALSLALLGGLAVVSADSARRSGVA